MFIKPGTLVLCNVYEHGEPSASPPEQKQALGIVISGAKHGVIWKGGISFLTKLIYPESLRDMIEDACKEDLLPIAQTKLASGNPPNLSEYLSEYLEEIVFTLAREICDLRGQGKIIFNLVREIRDLKKQVEFLKQANNVL